MSIDIAISRSDFSPAVKADGGFSSQIAISRSNDEPVMVMNFKTKNSATARAGVASISQKVKRRLHGFFVQEEDGEARVAFVENGQLIHYYLPLKLLKEGGVSVENQPFELDELEATIDGIAMKGYKVRAAARPQDSYVEELALDARSKENMKFLLSRVRNVTR